MGQPKGHTGNPYGRPKGSRNKFTQTAKEAFSLAFDEIGGYKGLADWAIKNRTDFYKLYSKLIPVDVTTGEKPITLSDLKAMSDAQLDHIAQALAQKFEGMREVN